MKDKNTAGILALLLGGIGIHRFYLGQNGLGILYLLFCWTLIPTVVGVIDAFFFWFMSKDKFNRKYYYVWPDKTELTYGDELIVVGMSYRMKNYEGVEKGTSVVLKREPSNEYDNNAVAVYDLNTRKMFGYISKEECRAVSNYLKGKNPYAADVKWRGDSKAIINVQTIQPLINF